MCVSVHAFTIVNTEYGQGSDVESLSLGRNRRRCVELKIRLTGAGQSITECELYYRALTVFHKYVRRRLLK